MSELRTLRLDVIAAYGTACSAERVELFRTAVSAVTERVESCMRAEHPSLCLRPQYLTFEQACARSDVAARCAAAILDTTEGDEQLALFLGRLQGGRVPYVVLCRTGSEEAVRRVGLSRSEIVVYGSIDELIRADSLLQQELLRAVTQARIHEELIYQFWFPRETSTIWVVCPQIHEASEYAERSSPDYTYLDNLGDTDALLDVMVFLSQYYPKATIERFSSTDLPQGHTSSNLVVIGGPGSDEISNDICGEMMRAMNAHVAYSSDCEQMIVTPDTGDKAIYQAEYRPSGQCTDSQAERGLRKDCGYFARFANPLNENAGVVLISGIHTAGVVGAARAFSESREALRNFDTVLASANRPTSFECHFEVLVMNGHVKVPLVDPRNILTLGKEETAGSARIHPIERVGTSRDSVTILFIAGDRGGTQVNQLQIPKEYHAIQEALRSCEHRDVIALGNPILGATRKQLAEAYRERPVIVHFAGHGNDRSLSIIEDRDVIASETPLLAEQLCDMFRTIKPRVRLCVLNTCRSKELAELLVKNGAVECAIGWSANVSDSAAIAFSRGLYDALGNGRSIADAVGIGKVASGTVEEPVLEAANGSAKIIADGEN